MGFEKVMARSWKCTTVGNAMYIERHQCLTVERTVHARAAEAFWSYTGAPLEWEVTVAWPSETGSIFAG